MFIYFVRHGESEANILHQFSNRGKQHPLTEKGRQQALSLAEHLQGKQIFQIYTSPLLRALQTAEIIADVLNISYTPTDALREFDCGILEGKSDEESWQQYECLMEDWLIHKKWSRSIEQGESLNDIRARFEPFLSMLQEQPKNLIAVGHGGVFRVILPLVFTNLPDDFGKDHHLSNTGYILGAYNQGCLTCLEWHT